MIKIELHCADVKEAIVMLTKLAAAFGGGAAPGEAVLRDGVIKWPPATEEMKADAAPAAKMVRRLIDSASLAVKRGRPPKPKAQKPPVDKSKLVRVVRNGKVYFRAPRSCFRKPAPSANGSTGPIHKLPPLPPAPVPPPTKTELGLARRPETQKVLCDLCKTRIWMRVCEPCGKKLCGRCSTPAGCAECVATEKAEAM